jgi:hypothetical protein
MLFGQVPLAAPGPQDLNYDLGTAGATGADADFDELGSGATPGVGTPVLANAVLLAFGTFAANSTPAIVAGQTKANVFTVEGTGTNPPGVNTIVEATVTAVTRNNIATIPGDANLNKQVNLADLTILGGNFNTSNKIWQQGDFNGDKLVNLADLTILGGRFNTNAATAAGAAVPEPSAFALMGAAVAGLYCLRRRR